MSILRAIVDFARDVQVRGGAVTRVELDEAGYRSLYAECASRAALDIHEVCGDYDRPDSPWFGSRPAPPALAVHTENGLVTIGKAAP